MAHIHDKRNFSEKKKTGKVRFIAQIAELIYSIPFQTNLTQPKLT